MTPREIYQKLLEEKELDGFLLSGRVNRRYAAGYDIAEGAALITAKECFYYTDSRYLEDAQRFLTGFTVLEVDREHSYTKRLDDAVTTLSLKRVGFEESVLTVGEYRLLSDRIRVELVPVQELLEAPRQVKTPEELESMKIAQRITDQSFSDVLKCIQGGVTELDLKAELLYRLYRNGSEGPSFDPIVISGSKTSVPHGVSGDKKLEYGDFITMDFGCKYHGYCSDMTRTVALGFVTEEMSKVYHTVLDAQAAAISATRAGVTGKTVDAVARDVIRAAGYEGCFSHSYGHGLGLEIHEAPNCSPSWDRPLPAGCVCSAEPGIYLPGKFGVRIEDVVCITDTGCDNFTKSPKKLLIL